MNAEFIRSLASNDSRLLTLKNWPYDSNGKCTAEKLTESGFFRPPNVTDLSAQCFVCFKELDGWDPDDDPYEEHKAHSPQCPLLTSKPYEEMTVREGLNMDIVRYINYLKHLRQQTINGLEAKVDSILKRVQNQLLASARKNARGRRAATARTVLVTPRASADRMLNASMASTRSLRSTRSKR